MTRRRILHIRTSVQQRLNSSNANNCYFSFQCKTLRSLFPRQFHVTSYSHSTSL